MSDHLPVQLILDVKITEALEIAKDQTGRINCDLYRLELGLTLKAQAMKSQLTCPNF